MAAKSLSRSASALAFSGTPALVSTPVISSFGRCSPALSELVMTLRRCENAALTTSKKRASSVLTGGSESTFSRMTAESTLGAGMNEPALTPKSISGLA